MNWNQKVLFQVECNSLNSGSLAQRYLPCVSTYVSTEYYNYFNSHNMKIIVFEVLICAL